MKTLCGPSSESDGYLRLYTITESYNHIKIVVVNVAFNLTVSLLTN